MKKNMVNILWASLLLVALCMPVIAGSVCDKTIPSTPAIYPGQEIVLTGPDNNGAGRAVVWSWVPSTTLYYNGVPLSFAQLHAKVLTFNAPKSGAYTVSLTVRDADETYNAACFDVKTICFTVTDPDCVLCSDAFCESLAPNGVCPTPTHLTPTGTMTYSYTGHIGSLVTKWFFGTGSPISWQQISTNGATSIVVNWGKSQQNNPLLASIFSPNGVIPQGTYGLKFELWTPGDAAVNPPIQSTLVFSCDRTVTKIKQPEASITSSPAST